MNNKLLLTETVREILKEYTCIAFINFEFTNAFDLLPKIEKLSKKRAVLQITDNTKKLSDSNSVNISQIEDGWFSLYHKHENIQEHFAKCGYVSVKPCWDEAKWQSLLFFKNTVAVHGSDPLIPLAESNNYNFGFGTDEYILREAVIKEKAAINAKRLLIKKILNLVDSKTVYYFNIYKNEAVFQLFLDKEMSVGEKQKYLQENFIILPFSLNKLHQINFEENKNIVFYDRLCRL